MIELNVNPLPHQEVAVEFAKRHSYVLIGDEMGLGKTVEAIIATAEIEGLILVICPSFLKYNWMAEYDQFTEGTMVTLVKNVKDIPNALISEVAIISYSMLKIALPLLKEAKAIIIDESHYLKNLESKRTQRVHIGVKRFPPEMLILLSGTPIKGKVEEFYSPLRLLSYIPWEGKNGRDITKRFKTMLSFARHFSNEETYRFKRHGREITVRNFKGTRNEPELASYLQYKYIRRKSSEVLDLPDLQEVTVYASYGKDDKHLQREWERHKVEEVSKHIASSKAKAALATAKFSAEYSINLHESGGQLPVLIFSDHVKPVLEIARILRKEGYRVDYIIGDTSPEERNKIVNKYKANELDFLVGSIMAMNTGLTLIQGKDVVFNDPNWSPSENWQAIKRIHRIGQDKKCMVHWVTGSVVGARIIKKIQEKIEVIKKVVDTNIN